jgi:hypothetical protein
MSEVDDLAFVITDGVLSEPWTIQRSTGSFQLGGWVTTSTTIDAWGVVSVAQPEDLEMIPEADQVTGIMVFHTQQIIYITRKDKPENGVEVQRVSDIMIWPVGTLQRWRILHVFPYPNRNYWKAFGVRMSGN